MLLCAFPGCRNVGSELSLIESRILSALRSWLDGYALEWDNPGRNAPDPAPLSQVLRQMDAEISALTTQRERLYDLLERGIYDGNTFTERMHSLTQRLAQAQEQCKGLRHSAKQQRSAPSPQRNHDAGRLCELYATLPSPKAKNELLREILAKVVYTKDKSGRWGHPDEFDLILYPRLPEKQRP